MIRQFLAGALLALLVATLAAPVALGSATPADRADGVGNAAARVRLGALPTSLVVTLSSADRLEATDAAAAAAGLTRVGWNPRLRTAQYAEAGPNTRQRALRRPSATDRSALAVAARRLRASGGVVAAEMPVRLAIDAAPDPVPPPDDPLAAEQWGLDAVGARTAWAIQRGDASIIVAVVDTGVDASHPDLGGAVLPGTDLENSDSDPSDDNGHGTHVAGIIAAISDNGLGIAGLASGVQILPVKVLAADGGGYDTVVAEGIGWAIDHGARVINLSLGGETRSMLLKTAIDDATSRGVLVVAAVGNENGPVSYPAAETNAVAVGALELVQPGSSNPAARYARATFSNHGPEVDVAGPGVGIVSTVPSAVAGTGYKSLSGTSMAAPYVSGVAALILSAQPTFTVAQLRATIEGSALDLGAAGRDTSTGFGLVRADRALEVVGTGPDTVAPSASLAGVPAGSAITGRRLVEATASDDRAVSSLRLELDAVSKGLSTAGLGQTRRVTRWWSSTGTSDGIHRWIARATDAAGNVREVTSKVLVANRHSTRTVRVSSTLSGSTRTLSRAVTLRIRSPFVARFSATRSPTVTLILRNSAGKVVASHGGIGTTWLAVGSVAPGRYTLSAVVSAPGTTVRLTADWYR